MWDTTTAPTKKQSASAAAPSRDASSALAIKRSSSLARWAKSALTRPRCRTRARSCRPRFSRKSAMAACASASAQASPHLREGGAESRMPQMRGPRRLYSQLTHKLQSPAGPTICPTHSGGSFSAALRRLSRAASSAARNSSAEDPSGKLGPECTMSVQELSAYAHSGI